MNPKQEIEKLIDLYRNGFYYNHESLFKDILAIASIEQPSSNNQRIEIATKIYVLLAANNDTDNGDDLIEIAFKRADAIIERGVKK